MSREIVKQPDGKFAVWSTIVDDFIYEDLSKDEVFVKMFSDMEEELMNKIYEYIKDAEKENNFYNYEDRVAIKKSLGRDE